MPQSLWVAAAALGLVLPAGLAAKRMLVSEPSADAHAGVRLGMTARQVRERFEPARAGGSWETSMGEEGLVIMDWTPPATTPGSSAAEGEARFELHEGLLVAVRATVSNPEMPTQPLIVSAGAVRRHQSLEPEGARITLLARSCPVHRAEVAALLGERD